MTSQLLTDTQKLAEDIVTAIEAHADEVDAGTHSALKSDLRQGERLPSAGLLLRLAGRRVHRTLTAYAAAEGTLDAERADDGEPRADRDTQTLSLYTEMKKVKGAIETLFGPSAVRKFQIPPELPRDPAVLAQAAGHVVTALKTHKLPAPQIEGVGKVDASAWIELLTSPLGRLKTARAKVNLEDKQLAAALDFRDRAYDAASEAMVEAVQLARAFARLADKDALFDRLRATPAAITTEPAEDPPADPAKPAPPAP